MLSERKKAAAGRRDVRPALQARPIRLNRDYGALWVRLWQPPQNTSWLADGIVMKRASFATAAWQPWQSDDAPTELPVL